MHFSTLVYTLATLSSAGLAQYTLEDDYFASGDFFSSFSFWNALDPTHGFVSYQSYSDALGTELVKQSTDYAYMGVNYTSISPGGRESVRLTSNKSYNSGLVIVDISHMPGGICGTWPAFWMVGPNWPYDGEIDIIEGVNDQTSNDMTLHTGPGCSISGNGGSTGSMTYSNCDSSSGDNSGCQITTSDSNTYGAGFNANDGGIYATEITDSGISIWFFPRNSIPSNVQSDSPDPSTWGTPLSMFQPSCSISSSFQQMQIVFDTTFCGDWAGNAWSGTCAQKATTCTDFVANNPSEFKDAYWVVNGLKVYSSSGSSYTNPGTTTTPAPTSATAVPAPTTTFATSAIAPAPTGSGPLSGSVFNPNPSSGSGSDSGSDSGSGSGSGSSTGSGPLSGSVFNPNPSSSGSDSTPSSGSGALSGSVFNPGAGSGTGDSSQNAAAPGDGSASSGASGAWAPSSSSNGVITEHQQSSRRARLARHLRQHRVRHMRRGRA